MSPLSRVEFKEQFYGATCTIELADFAKAQEEIPALKDRTPEQVCLDYVLQVPIAMIPTTEDGGEKIGTAELLFDRNEPFLKYVDRLWRSPKRRKGYHFLRHVSDVRPTDSRTDPPLQAVDFLAWATNRAFSTHDAYFNFARCMTVPMVGMHLDYDKFVKEYAPPADQEKSE
jgi:hypothetical protein